MLELNGLKNVEKPARYIGGEKGAAYKQVAQNVNIALCVPRLYEDVMLNTSSSSMWLKQMYWYLNKKTNIYCQRVMAIGKDFEKVLSNNNEKLCTLEQFTPLKDMDIIIACIDDVMEYTSFLNILKNAGIPMLSSRRKDDFPFIILTGDAVYNPHPMNQFVDAYIYGNNMAIMDNILLKYNWWKRQQIEKYKFLKDISDTTGVFVPDMVNHDENKDNLDNKIFMATYDNLDSEITPNIEVIPNIKTTQDNVSICVCRGCVKNCTNCLKRYVYGQANFLSYKNALKKIDIATKYSGISDVGLGSTCYVSHDKFYDLIKEIKQLTNPVIRNIYLGNVALDTDNLWLLDYLKQYPQKYNYIPRIKVGGATYKQRKFLGIDITDEQIKKVAEAVFSKEYPYIVLEYTIGVPSETKEDLLNILTLSSKIATTFEKICSKLPEKQAVLLKVTGFRAMPHTPSQYASVNDAKTILEKQEFLRIANDNPYVSFEFENPYMHEVKALLTKGSETVSSILHSVAKQGASLEYIEDNFAENIWKDAIAKSGIDIKDLCAEKPLDYAFCWDNILVSTSKGLVKEEYIKMKEYTKLRRCKLK